MIMFHTRRVVRCIILQLGSVIEAGNALWLIYVLGAFSCNVIHILRFNKAEKKTSNYLLTYIIHTS